MLDGCMGHLLYLHVSVRCSFSRSLFYLVTELIIWLDHSVGRSVGRSIGRSVDQSVGQAGQSVSQLIFKPFLILFLYFLINLVTIRFVRCRFV